MVVEDDQDVAEMLNAYFTVQGYEMRMVNKGETAVHSAQADPPDLVILDIRLPDIDGFEVAFRLRNDRHTKEVPIIFLTERRARSDRLQGLELGADDYITKPFDVQELRLRVRNALNRSSQGSLTNPVTTLPDGALVDERLAECLKSKDWAMIIVSLANIDRFRELYGFVAADDLLRAVSLMIHNAIREIGGTGDFVGHFSADEILVVTTPVHLEQLAERIGSRIEQSLDYFYPLRDRDSLSVLKHRLAVRLTQFTPGLAKFADVQALRSAMTRLQGARRSG